MEGLPPPPELPNEPEPETPGVRGVIALLWSRLTPFLNGFGGDERAF